MGVIEMSHDPRGIIGMRGAADLLLRQIADPHKKIHSLLDAYEADSSDDGLAEKLLRDAVRTLADAAHDMIVQGAAVLRHLDK